jgi:hypothetical protein
LLLLLRMLLLLLWFLVLLWLLLWLLLLWLLLLWLLLLWLLLLWLLYDRFVWGQSPYLPREGFRVTLPVRVSCPWFEPRTALLM